LKDASLWISRAFQLNHANSIHSMLAYANKIDVSILVLIFIT